MVDLIAGVLDSVRKPALDVLSFVRVYRITSYNVCYTKLLRRTLNIVNRSFFIRPALASSNKDISGAIA